MDTQLREGINWIGYVDWTVRDFHGYTTDRGSTYNAYLVQDEKTAVIDSVKAPYADVLMRHLAVHTDPADVDYIVCNHAEPDHSGSIGRLVRECPKAKLVCDAKCKTTLEKHYDAADWPFEVVNDGDTLSLGKRTLTFLETPMVHWPESMATYIAEEKLLFSMDGFGQHYASSHRFDDEEPLDVLLHEAKTYYANIVMLYGRPIQRVLERAGALDIQTIAPSHGVIWRKHIGDIMGAYQEWVRGRVAPKVLVVYDTMWKSTEMMAQAIMDGAAETGVEAKLLNVRASNITVLATEALDAATFAFGTPTLNKTLMPAMAGALTYLKGLAPQKRAGFAFGSYGWAKGGVQGVEAYMKDMKFELLREPLQSQFVPDAALLDECVEAGRLLGKTAVDRAAAQDA